MKLICSACGRGHWPAQKWMHEYCVRPVNHQQTATNEPVVVNAVNVAVVNRTKDRHKKTPERLEYIKKKMREYRTRAKRG